MFEQYTIRISQDAIYPKFELYQTPHEYPERPFLDISPSNLRSGYHAEEITGLYLEFGRYASAFRNIPSPFKAIFEKDPLTSEIKDFKVRFIAQPSIEANHLLDALIDHPKLKGEQFKRDLHACWPTLQIEPDRFIYRAGPAALLSGDEKGVSRETSGLKDYMNVNFQLSPEASRFEFDFSIIDTATYFTEEARAESYPNEHFVLMAGLVFWKKFPEFAEEVKKALQRPILTAHSFALSIHPYLEIFPLPDTEQITSNL